MQLVQDHKRRRLNASRRAIPPVGKMTKFVPKYDLPVLEDYNEDKYSANYWSKWVKRSLAMVLPGRSWVSIEGLRDLAVRADFPDKTLLDKVCGL